MNALDMLRSMLEYSDWATAVLLAAAGPLPDAQLDATVEMGPGTLRRTLQHVQHFEAVYLERWQGHGEMPWPAYEDTLPISTLADRFRATWAARDAWLSRLTDADLRRDIRWRDSRGGDYCAPLSDALLQVCTHSTHHRAQAVNMLRRLAGVQVEIDHMMHVRRPA